MKSVLLDRRKEGARKRMTDGRADGRGQETCLVVKLMFLEIVSASTALGIPFDFTVPGGDDKREPEMD